MGDEQVPRHVQDLRNSALFRSAHKIDAAVTDMAHQIDLAYGADPELVIVPILTGGMVLAMDLMRALEYRRSGRVAHVYPLSVRRYHADVAPGTITFGGGSLADPPPSGSHILIVDDILDAGVTLDRVIKMMDLFNPASVTAAVLIDRPTTDRSNLGYLMDVEVIAGITTEQENWFFGYGMDLNGHYRGLHEVRMVVRDEPTG